MTGPLNEDEAKKAWGWFVHDGRDKSLELLQKTEAEGGLALTAEHAKAAVEQLDLIHRIASTALPAGATPAPAAASAAPKGAKGPSPKGGGKAKGPPAPGAAAETPAPAAAPAA